MKTMNEKDYVVRRIEPTTPRRRAPQGSPQRPPVRRAPPQRRRRGRGGPPPIFLLAGVLAVVAIAAIIIAIVVNTGKKDDKKPKENSSAASALASQASGITSNPAAPVSSAPQPAVSDPIASMSPQDAPNAAPEQLDALVLIEDAGYEYYNFVEENTNNYIKLVSEAGEALSNTSTLYEMVVPTSMDIMLPESYISEHNVNSSDQRKAIEDYMYPSIKNMNPDVKTVSLFDTLKLHSNEYIYFRTDHHWTQLGAFYAYQEFCKVANFTPLELEDFDKESYDGFLGSFYKDCLSSAMQANPDTVEAYFPPVDASLTYTTSDGTVVEGQPVIQDGSAYDPEWLYLIFISGDQPYEEIVNNGLDDGSACIVVKESFGNAFVPFLVPHYQHVYVVDYRYYSGSVVDLAQEKNAQDVILINNISMTRSADRISELSSVF